MRFVPLLPLLLLAAGCIAAEADPPSLGPRAIEGVLDEPARAIAPVASADDPALAARIGELVAEAEAGDARFAEQLPAAEQAVSRAAGSVAESEAWIVAQVELSALEGARSPTTTALGALDEIFARQAIDGAPAETEALSTARERVAALYEGQAERFSALQAMLSTR